MMDSHGNGDDFSSPTMLSLVPVVDYDHHQHQNEHHHQLTDSSSSIDDHVLELAQLSAGADWPTTGMQQTASTTIALFDVNGLLDPFALWMPHYFGGSDQVADSASSDGTTIVDPWQTLVSGNGLHSHSEVVEDAEGDDHGQVTSTSTSTKSKKKMTKVITFERFICAHCNGFKAKHRSILMEHMNTAHPRECPLMLKGCVHRDENDKNAACRRKVISTSWLCAHPDCSVRVFSSKKSLQTHYHRYHEKGEFRCAKCVASAITFEYQAAVYAHAQDKHPTAKMAQSRGMAPKRNYPKKKENYQRGVTGGNADGSLANVAKVDCPWKDPRSAKLGKSAKVKVSVCGKSFATTGNMKRHFQVAHPEQFPMLKWERKKYIRKKKIARPS